MDVKTARIDHRLQKISGCVYFASLEKQRRLFEQENHERHVVFYSNIHTRNARVRSFPKYISIIDVRDNPKITVVG